jgi:TorA maturation chaperone TorD
MGVQWHGCATLCRASPSSEQQGRAEPEDHVAILCEIMAGLIRAEIPAPVGADRQFFVTHLASWIRRFR